MDAEFIFHKFPVRQIVIVMLQTCRRYPQNELLTKHFTHDELMDVLRCPLSE